MIRLGLIGVGVGARQLLPALTQHPNVRLHAAADLRLAALQQLEAEFGVATYSSVAELCEQQDIDAVWVASPNHLHAEHAIAAAEHGNRLASRGWSSARGHLWRSPGGTRRRVSPALRALIGSG